MRFNRRIFCWGVMAMMGLSVAHAAEGDALERRLLEAAAQGDAQAVRTLLAQGANQEARDGSGATPLLVATHNNQVQAAQVLIAAGVDVNHVNNLHWTALMEAIVLGQGGPQHVEIVRQLLDAKADVHLADAQGVTPLQHARQRGYAQIEALLLRAGAQR